MSETIAQPSPEAHIHSTIARHKLQIRFTANIVVVKVHGCGQVHTVAALTTVHPPYCDTACFLRSTTPKDIVTLNVCCETRCEERMLQGILYIISAATGSVPIVVIPIASIRIARYFTTTFTPFKLRLRGTSCVVDVPDKCKVLVSAVTLLITSCIRKLRAEQCAESATISIVTFCRLHPRQRDFLLRAVEAKPHCRLLSVYGSDVAKFLDR